ncbi:thiamine phosphate synthase [Sorangium sp. So ce302]|uniref:thiamine phosphate synthase n=1 Tax=Sorangium sp. So ce302 TaxID=3133297 RepID=UPI003F637348
MRGLYAIVDTDSLARRGLDPAAFAEAVLDARPAAIQLRDKRGGAAQTLSLLRAIQLLAARAGVPLFANDRADLAILARCDGVHVGQDDLPVAAVRRLAQRASVPLRVGLSTHTSAQIEAALRASSELRDAGGSGDSLERLDYVAIGPIFATSSKERPDAVVGLEGLASLCAMVERVRPGLPVVAIGGISLERAAEVGARCSAAAIIAALLPDQGTPAPRAFEEVSARARALQQALSQALALAGARAAPVDGGAR